MPKEIKVSYEITGIWNPEKAGETVKGFYAGKEKFGDKFDNYSYLVDDGNGAVLIINSYAVLERDLARVPEGAFIQVTYEGEKKGERYNYKSFKVRAWVLDDSERSEWSNKTDIESVTMKERKESNGIDPDTQTDAGTDDDLPF